MRSFNLILAASCCLLSYFMSSCSEDNDYLQEIEQNPNAIAKTCTMTFDGSFQGFDSSEVTRSNTEWSDGDKVYLVLSESVHGIAEYASGVWTLSYYGDLKSGEYGTCTAYYFENTKVENYSKVEFDHNSSIYKETEGKYTYDGITLSVTANLKPAVGRIRFAGTPDSTLTVIGITTYSSYSISQEILTSSDLPIKLTVQSDGYTPYIYGHFTSQEEPRLNVMTGESGFNRKFSSSIFQKGESGFMNIPTLKSHNGWMNNLYFKVDSVGFTMIPVQYNSSVFYLGETEVTQALYTVVNNHSAPTDPNHPQAIKYSLYPNYSSQTNSCSAFISRLNSKTNMSFRLPTRTEWQYAAKGGELSQGYTYSGSNEISEVAWYESNSGGKVHDVAQLMPNELGFYDMSGNLMEWTSTRTNTYYPSYYDYCGGCFNYSSDNCKVTYYSYHSERTNTGIRLALSIN